MKPFKFIFISLVVMLVMTNVTPSFHHYAQADEDHKKLKYKKNSALALNYHRVRKKDALNDLLQYFQVAKKLKIIV